MPRDHVLAIIQAGGAGGRMDVLTRERAKPALPFAGVHQLIDFPLSNLTHSGITDVWLSVQFQGSTLEEEIANGRPWDLDRNRGGLRLLMPQEGSGSAHEDGFAQGNADELYRIRDQVRAAGADAVVVLSADHVYRFDFSEALETHRSRGAECTVVTTRTPEGDAPGDHAVVQVDNDGKVTSFDYKPDEPATDVVATEIFVYDPAVLIEVIEELYRELAGEDGTGLGDFGDHLLPRLVERGRTYAHTFDGYWRDVGQPHLYLRAHQEVLTSDDGVLDDRDWPILTRQVPRVPARVLDGATVSDSLLSPGVRVSGTVRRSVLGPGVVVEPGAEVSDSVLFADTVVRSGAKVAWSVLDSDCVVEEGATVGDPDTCVLDDADSVTLLGRGSVVGAGVEIPTGSRLEPGTTA